MNRGLYPYSFFYFFVSFVYLKMDAITVYGTLFRWKIFVNDIVYSLTADSRVHGTVGWFTIEREGKRWRLWRMLFKYRTDQYIDDDGTYVVKR